MAPLEVDEVVVRARPRARRRPRVRPHIARRLVALVGAAAVVAGASAGCGDDTGATSGTTSTLAGYAAAWEAIDLAGRPAAAVHDGTALVVVDDAGGLLQRVTGAPGDRTAASTPVGGQLVGVAGVAGVVWVIDATGTVTRVDPAGGTERPAVDLGGTLVDILATDRAVYVGDLEQHQVVELDPSSLAVRRRIDVPAGVVRLALDGDRLWVTGTERSVTPVDLVAGVAGEAAEVGNGPIGVVVAADTVWVANGDDATVSRLDAATGARRGPDVPVGSGPIALAVRGDAIWVLDQDSAAVTVLAAGTGQRTEPDIPLPRSLARARDLVASDAGVWVVGVDRPQALFLPLP